MQVRDANRRLKAWGACVEIKIWNTSRKITAQNFWQLDRSQSQVNYG